MTECILCNKKIKFARKCPTLNEVICSTCCGSKRESEIQCTNSCKHFVEGRLKENKKQIMQIVKESFNTESEDIFRDLGIIGFIAPFELTLFERYYNHIDITDEFISDCYTKIYYFLEGKWSIYTFNEIEKDIFDVFNRSAINTEMPIESQKLILLRLIKSVDSMTGGRFGNRMYLELLRHKFTGTGIVSKVMAEE